MSEVLVRNDQLVQVFQEIGLSDAQSKQAMDKLLSLSATSSGGVDELAKLRAREEEIMTLIKCQKKEKMMHDLRNVLNELMLLRAVANLDAK